MAGEGNKTLVTKCGSCDKELTTFVDSDTSNRTTWPLVGERNGELMTFAACTACYEKGWRPDGYRDQL